VIGFFLLSGHHSDNIFARLVPGLIYIVNEPTDGLIYWSSDHHSTTPEHHGVFPGDQRAEEGDEVILNQLDVFFDKEVLPFCKGFSISSNFYRSLISQ
jgi:hypothetical protein